MEKIKEEVLIAVKKQTQQLYADRIQLEEFIEYLYSDEVVDVIGTSGFLFDLIEVNYRSEDWKIDLEKVMFNYMTEDEMLAMKLCNYSLRIIKSENFESCLEEIQKIVQKINFDVDIDFILEFYYILYEIEEWQFYYKSKEKMQSCIMQESKGLATCFVEGYRECILIEDYQKLLYENSYSRRFHREEFVKPIDSKESILDLKIATLEAEKEEYQKGVFVYLLLGGVVSFVGIIALEKERFSYAFLVVGIGLLLSALYYLKLLLQVSSKIEK